MAMMATVVLVGCKKDKIQEEVIIPEVPATEESIVTLTFSPYQIEPIRDSSPISTYANHLDVYIFDTLDMVNPVVRVHQNTTYNPEFGTVSASLQTNKYYTLYAVAHKCNDTISLNGDVISFPEDNITHSFFYKTTFTPAEGLTLNCNMPRIVGMFRMTTTDAVSEDINKFEFVIDSTTVKWNVNGYSENVVERIKTYEGFALNNNGTVTLNLFLLGENMEDTYYVNITANAYVGNELRESREFVNVPVKAGWRATYTGTFFITFGMTLNFTADDWEEFDPINFTNG